MRIPNTPRPSLSGRVASGILLIGGISLALSAIGSSVFAVPTFGVLLAVQAFWPVVLGFAVVPMLIGMTLAIVSQRGRLVVMSVILVALTIAVTAVAVVDRSGTDGAAVLAKGGSLRVLSWNTDQQDVSVRQLETLIGELRPDVVALPEYFPQVASGTLRDLAVEHGLQIVGTENSSATLLVSDRLGRYQVSDAGTTPAWAGFLARSTNRSAPTLLVAHLQRPSVMSASTWASHVGWVRRACAADSNLVAVGDFNGTNANLRSAGPLACRDAATTLGVNSTGTWPTGLPPRLGATIDHVMTSKNWKVRSYAVLGGREADGSDHRPIFVTVDARE